MAQVELIPLQRGQARPDGRAGEGEVGYAQLPVAAEEGDPRQPGQRRSSRPSAQLEAQNIKRREEVMIVERVGGLTVVIRQAGESGNLYGSVSSRDIAEACSAGGLSVNRNQVVLEHPIKTLGLAKVSVVLHPEVMMPVTVNVARSPEEAERQVRGEAVGNVAEEADVGLEALLDAQEDDAAGY
jgi:large subunit ribosomal protein L9